MAIVIREVHPEVTGATSARRWPRDVAGWFTGRDIDGADPAVGVSGNLSHRRPHVPAQLARDRRDVASTVGVSTSRWHLMDQVHGNRVAVIDEAVPAGTQMPAADAMVTDLDGRALVVLVADCVPVLLAGPRTIGAVHAGRKGVQLDVVASAVEVMVHLGDPANRIAAAIGPAIGPCCYEVPAQMRDAVSESAPSAAATTTWGTPSLDLRTSIIERLNRLGVAVETNVATCTRCDPEARWFSHRRDASTGRQAGIIARGNDGRKTAVAPGGAHG